MLLARLLALAVSANVAAAALLRHSGDREARVDPGFHKRDPAIPDVKNQSFKTTEKCTIEREQLSARLDELIAERARLDSTCATEISHYEDMNAMADVQIRNLKKMVDDKKDESELPPLYREKYEAIMCEKVYDGFVMQGDSESRQEVLDICNGTKSLRECSLKRNGLDNMSYGYFKHLQNQTELLWSHHTGDEKENLTASPECFQAKQIQDQVDSTRNATLEKSKYCEAKQTNLTNAIDNKRKEEDALWAEYHGHISQREPIKKNASAEVKTKFCVGIAMVVQNYSTVDRGAIKTFYDTECVPSFKR